MVFVNAGPRLTHKALVSLRLGVEGVILYQHPQWWRRIIFIISINEINLKFFMDILELNENEMLEALSRSGYLLESQISQILSKAGFFIETNQVIKDPLTNKNREIDLIAEYYQHKEERMDMKCCSKIHFVFEIKNNSAPIVLLTNFEYSPNVEDWNGLKERLTIPKGFEYDTSDAYYQQIIHTDKYPRYTQYCSFQRKKGNEELMALHPDNIYEGLSKITQYCEEMIKDRKETNNKDTSQLLNSEQNPEECDATDDDSSNTAGPVQNYEL